MQSSLYNNLSFEKKVDLLFYLRKSLIENILEGRKLATSKEITSDLSVKENNSLSKKEVAIEEMANAFPLTEMQEAFLVSRFLTKNSDYIGCHIYIEMFAENIDIVKLKAAWEKVVARHFMLRVVVSGKGHQQLVSDSSIDDFNIHDALDGARAAQVRETMLHRVYEPDQWPLFDIQITKYDEESCLIHFSIDEWIADGPSVSILLEEWYRAYHKGNISDRPLRSKFYEYQKEAKAKLDKIKLKDDILYWRNKFSRIEKGYASQQLVSMSLDRTLNRNRHIREIDGETWGLIKNRCKSLSISPTAFLLTLYSYVLYYLEGKVALPLPVTVSNRLPIVPDVELIVGPFMTTTLFMTELEDENKLIPLLQSNQNQIWNDLGHDDVTGISVLRDLKTQTIIDRNYSIPFVFTSMIGNFNRKSDTWFKGKKYFSTQTPQVYMDNQVYEENGNLVINWDVADEAFKDGIVDRHINIYENIIRVLARENVSWGNASLENLVA